MSILQTGVTLGLTLDRYQELMRIAPAAFNGLTKADEKNDYDCSAIWKQTDRDALALAIATAEEMREAELGYFLYPRYSVDTKYSSINNGNGSMYFNPIILNRKHLVSVGVEESETLYNTVVLVYDSMSGEATFVIDTSIVSLDEIKMYHPDTDIEIHPSNISILGSAVVVTIPRYRLAKLTLNTNDETVEYDYYDDNNFIEYISVKRVYHNEVGGIVYAKATCTSPLINTEYTGKAVIVDYRLAIIRAYPATYSDGVWTANSLCSIVDKVTISYKSGRQMSTNTELSTARLAHTLLPRYLPERNNLCGRCWEKDILVNSDNYVLTPYGDAAGAIAVWMMDSRAKVGQGGKFPAMR